MKAGSQSNYQILSPAVAHLFISVIIYCKGGKSIGQSGETASSLPVVQGDNGPVSSVSDKLYVLGFLRLILPGINSSNQTVL